MSMKNLFTICTIVLVSCLGMSVSAQKLASFENPDEDLLVKGDKWYEPARFVVEPSIGDNSAKGGLNTTEKCFVAVNAADADWWGNFGELKLKTPITITESNRYLRFLAYRSIQPKNFRIAVNGEHEAEAYQGKLSKDGEWEGVVVDLGAKLMGQELTSIVFVFSCNWSDPRSGWGTGTYMFDEFELSDKPLPPGVVEVEDLSGFNIGFENEAVTNQWISKFDMIHESNSYEIVDNPVSSDINPTAKVAKFNKSADASWWQGFRMEFNGALKISPDYKYLHAMVWVPSEALGDEFSVDVQLCAKDFSGTEQTYMCPVWDDMCDDWVDIVTPVTTISYMTELTVRFNILKEGEVYVNSPANTFYLDGIVLNDDPDPRYELTSGIRNQEVLDGIRVAGGTGVINVSTSQPTLVKVYNTVGSLLYSASIQENTKISLAKGLHIVQLESEGRTKAVKVLVK